MSRLYDNIKALCKYRSVLMSDIEKPLNAGTISRYERRGTIMNLPIGLVYRASKMLDVPIEKLLETDIANEIWGEKMSNEIYGIFKKSELSDELVEDLHKQVDLILEYVKKKRTEQTEPNSSEKPNNCKPQNYCDDCLYTDTCDSKEFFYACTSKATISKMEQVDKDINVRSKDEPQTMLNDGTLVINVEDATKVGRVLVGDDKNRGDLYYPDDKDEPQTELVRVKYHCINCAENGSYKCSKCDGEMYYKYDKDEPQTERSSE